LFISQILPRIQKQPLPLGRGSDPSRARQQAAVRHVGELLKWCTNDSREQMYSYGGDVPIDGLDGNGAVVLDSAASMASTPVNVVATATFLVPGLAAGFAARCWPRRLQLWLSPGQPRLARPNRLKDRVCGRNFKTFWDYLPRQPRPDRL
jgi:hypothetical protein